MLHGVTRGSELLRSIQILRGPTLITLTVCLFQTCLQSCLYATLLLGLAVDKRGEQRLHKHHRLHISLVLVILDSGGTLNLMMCGCGSIQEIYGVQYHRVQSPPSDDFVDQMEKMCNSMVWCFGVLAKTYVKSSGEIKC